MQNDQILDDGVITCCGYELPPSSWTILDISGVVHGELAVASTTCAGGAVDLAMLLSMPMLSMVGHFLIVASVAV